MKRTTFILAVFVLVASMISACAGNKKCPAYSQVKTKEVKANS